MKRKLKTTPYDAAEYLKTEEDFADFIKIAVEESGGDGAHVAKAMGVVARARGMRSVAEKSGAGLESLYKSLNGVRVPSLTTFLKTLDALGLKMEIVPQKPRRLMDDLKEAHEDILAHYSGKKLAKM